jgi:hypothetical protein
MAEERRRVGLRAVLGILAVALVATVLWAASALAAGGSGSSTPDSGDSPGVANTQPESQAPDRDCPNHDNGSGFEQSADV